MVIKRGILCGYQTGICGYCIGNIVVTIRDIQWLSYKEYVLIIYRNRQWLLYEGYIGYHKGHIVIIQDILCRYHTRNMWLYTCYGLLRTFV